MSDAAGNLDEFIIMIPIYNDWEALSLLLPVLDKELTATGMSAEVLIVDDGSPASQLDSIVPIPGFESIEAIDILSLRRNLGHQRAIAVGLSYIESNRRGRSVLVMDGDGEDDPADVPRLIRECIAKKMTRIVFAARIRRSESWLFRICYHVYRLVHYLLTGVSVRVGNFSAIPAASLRRLVAVSELWNHYAAAVYKARLPSDGIPTTRGRRLNGSPHMSLVALVVHGLSAMAVFGDRIGVRLLIVIGAAMGVLSTVILTVFGVRVFTTLAVPGWATYVTGLLVVMLMQMLLVVLIFAFVILAARDNASIVPSRDYVHFVDSIERVYEPVQESIHWRRIESLRPSDTLEVLR